MKAQAIIPYGVTLPLPAFVLHPLTALGLAFLHIYLAAGHLSKLFLGPMHWTDIWKGFGALAAAYVFAALATRGLAWGEKTSCKNHLRLGSEWRLSARLFSACGRPVVAGSGSIPVSTLVSNPASSRSIYRHLNSPFQRKWLS